MSSRAPTDAGRATRAHEETVHGSGRAHPSDRRYVGVALVLGVITAAEVVTFYVEQTIGGLLIPVLLVMMVAKFAIVAGWFMHLRFDSNLFTRLFVTGLLLAVSVYIVALSTFQFFA
ncbi:MAG: cytochrome C oxidase subunit IV family protein [Acidimicrobiales bacterium]